MADYFRAPKATAELFDGSQVSAEAIAAIYDWVQVGTPESEEGALDATLYCVTSDGPEVAVATQYIVEDTESVGNTFVVTKLILEPATFTARYTRVPA